MRKKKDGSSEMRVRKTEREGKEDIMQWGLLGCVTAL